MFIFSSTAMAYTTDQLKQAEDAIPNFHVVSPNPSMQPTIFRGGNPIDSGKNGIAALAPLNVATDIDLQGGDSDALDKLLEPGETPQMIQSENQDTQQYNMKFISLLLSSHTSVTSDEDKEIDSALQLLKAASPEHPVFIHCEHGSDRTGLVIALYRVLVQGWNVNDAVTEWQNL